VLLFGAALERGDWGLWGVRDLLLSLPMAKVSGAAALPKVCLCTFHAPVGLASAEAHCSRTFPSLQLVSMVNALLLVRGVEQLPGSWPNIPLIVMSCDTLGMGVYCLGDLLFLASLELASKVNDFPPARAELVPE